MFITIGTPELRPSTQSPNRSPNLPSLGGSQDDSLRFTQLPSSPLAATKASEGIMVAASGRGEGGSADTNADTDAAAKTDAVLTQSGLTALNAAASSSTVVTSSGLAASLNATVSAAEAMADSTLIESTGQRMRMLNPHSVAQPSVLEICTNLCRSVQICTDLYRTSYS